MKKQISYTGLMDGLRNGRARGKFVRKRMGKGTRTNMPPVQTLLIECDWLDETLVAHLQTPTADTEA